MDEPNNVNVEGAPAAKVSTGPIIGGVIILAIVILGGLYFWNQRDAVVSDETNSQSVESIQTQSQSDEATAIEADLNATDVNSIDAGLNTPQ